MCMLQMTSWSTPGELGQPVPWGYAVVVTPELLVHGCQMHEHMVMDVCGSRLPMCKGVQAIYLPLLIACG